MNAEIQPGVFDRQASQGETQLAPKTPDRNPRIVSKGGEQSGSKCLRRQTCSASRRLGSERWHPPAGPGRMHSSALPRPQESAHLQFAMLNLAYDPPHKTKTSAHPAVSTFLRRSRQPGSHNRFAATKTRHRRETNQPRKPLAKRTIGRWLLRAATSRPSTFTRFKLSLSRSPLMLELSNTTSGNFLVSSTSSFMTRWSSRRSASLSSSRTSSVERR